MQAQLHDLLDRVLDVPPLLRWRMKRFDAAFGAGSYGGVCRGVFDSYEAAAASAPHTLPLGFDNEGAAALYRDRLHRLYPADYPMLLWLRKAFDDGARRVFDLGGHVGVGYYAYQRLLPYPDGLGWQVHDVPAVMAAGRELARAEDKPGRLSFVDEFEAAAQADVLFTSGCLQFLPQSFGQRIAGLSRRPRWLLVNLLPLHDDMDYWTVQSIARAFCPYHIQKRGTFFGELLALGYEILDIWENPEKRCPVAFSPRHSLDGYFGATLRLT